jgi:hypothetical protein
MASETNLTELSLSETNFTERGLLELIPFLRNLGIFVD